MQAIMAPNTQWHATQECTADLARSPQATAYRMSGGAGGGYADEPYSAPSEAYLCAIWRNLHEQFPVRATIDQMTECPSVSAGVRQCPRRL